MIKKNLSGLGALQIWDAELAFAHLQSIGQATPQHIANALEQLQAHVGKDLAVFPHDQLTSLCHHLAMVPMPSVNLLAYPSGLDPSKQTPHANAALSRARHLLHLKSESIHINREAVADAEIPVMLYAVGKDSSVIPIPATLSAKAEKSMQAAPPVW